MAGGGLWVIDPLRARENIFYPRRDAKGREEHLLCLNQDLRDSDGLGDGWRLVGET